MSLKRLGSFTAAVIKFARYKLQLLGVQEIGGEKGRHLRAGKCNYFYRKEQKTINLQEFFCTPLNNISS